MSCRPDLTIRRSRSISWTALQFMQQQGLGQPPIAHDGVGLDIQHLGCLLHAQPAEEAQFHYTTLPLVNFGQSAAITCARGSSASPKRKSVEWARNSEVMREIRRKSMYR